MKKITFEDVVWVASRLVYGEATNHMTLDEDAIFDLCFRLEVDFTEIVKSLEDKGYDLV